MHNGLLGCNLCQCDIDFLLKNSYKNRVKNHTVTKIVLPELNTLKGNIPFRCQTNNRTFLLIGHGKRQNKSKLDWFVFDVLIRSKNWLSVKFFRRFDAMPNWYWEKKDLRSTPSQDKGLDFGTEARYRREGVR